MSYGRSSLAYTGNWSGAVWSNPVWNSSTPLRNNNLHFGLSDFYSSFASSSTDESLAFSGKYASVDSNLANSYYAKVMMDKEEIMRLNSNMIFDSGSDQMPLWQATKGALLTDMNASWQMASGWNRMSNVEGFIGRFGSSVGMGIDMVSGLYEFRQNPTLRNGMVIQGGVTGGILASMYGEEFISSGALVPEVILTLTAPEFVLPIIGVAALTTLGIFAGKALGGLAYDVGRLTENKAENIWRKDFKN